MTLTSALAAATSPGSRSKGEHYFHSHAVVHFDPQQSMVYAVVHGTDDYVVRIEVAGTEVRGTCTCPFFTDRLQPCKHVWAVALMCDARGVVQVPDTPGARHVAFVPRVLDDELDLAAPLDDPEFARPETLRPGRPASLARAATPPWEQALLTIAADARLRAAHLPPVPGQILYVIDRAGSRSAEALVVYLLRQERKQGGDWGAPKPARLVSSALGTLPADDQAILEQVTGARPASAWQWGGGEIASPFYLRGLLASQLVPLLCRTGRCVLALTEVPTPRPQDSPLVPLAWSDDIVTGRLQIVREEQDGVYRIDGRLDGSGRTIPLDAVHLLLDGGLIVAGAEALRMDPAGTTPWLLQLSQRSPLRVPLEQSALLRDTLRASGVTSVDGLPDELRTTVITARPTPHLRLADDGETPRLWATLLFSYDGGDAQPSTDTLLVPTADPQVMARRDAEAEAAARARLDELGVRRAWNNWERRQSLQVPAASIPRLVRALVPDGWQIESDSARYHMIDEPPALAVSSGIDWFELRADLAVDGQRIALPKLLDALRRRDGIVSLDDGSIGVLPEPWLRDLAPLALGVRDGDHLRFRRSQVALLDALLASRPAVSWDDAAAAARNRLRAFEHIAPLDAPVTFTGTLREYQREALGWLQFLREFGFGGCLADDMGLGKTVVVLALLEDRRQARAAAGDASQPSLVVVPRSVLFNWQQEAARFAPGLRVLDFSGADRNERLPLITASDLVLATYGTLRRDAVALADVEFDYVVLDEAQTIKNANTAGAKAARLLQGHHRLALSGTPVENRLADLWSLFEFLNPGLLSGATAFGRSFSGSSSEEELGLLARGLRPFILRRTKEQVAVELPAKTEQTLVCQLERRQRALYDELRDHYRRQFLGRSSSWQRSRLQVLEALLRLRQAACHPGLIDPAQAGEPSAKLDLLVPRLVEAVEEGHKALVFSQFTSFLALLRRQLDDRLIPYEYLDGATRDREARVSRFQTDPACGLFLISLKAGGVGLNLTAADYVFILDPWWNPAAEAQAVDRTHRIGQSRNVFAYRLIARDTVEERVLELQLRKRELADAVITADNSVVRALQREDLELLLS